MQDQEAPSARAVPAVRAVPSARARHQRRGSGRGWSPRAGWWPSRGTPDDAGAMAGRALFGRGGPAAPAPALAATNRTSPRAQRRRRHGRGRGRRILGKVQRPDLAATFQIRRRAHATHHRTAARGATAESVAPMSRYPDRIPRDWFMGDGTGMACRPASRRLQRSTDTRSRRLCGEVGLQSRQVECDRPSPTSLGRAPVRLGKPGHSAPLLVHR